MQIQAQSLSTIGAKIVIALNGKRNSNGGVFAAESNGRSSGQRTLRVAGTIAMKRGWKASVRIFSKDKSWVAKGSSGFSCHLLKTFDECTDKFQAQVLAQIFSFSSDQMNDSNSTSDDANAFVSRRDDLVHTNKAANDFSDDVMSSRPSILVRTFAMIALTLEIFCG